MNDQLLITESLQLDVFFFNFDQFFTYKADKIKIIQCFESTLVLLFIKGMND